MVSNRTLLISGGVLLLGAGTWFWWQHRRPSAPEELATPPKLPVVRAPKALPLDAELWAGIRDVADRLDMDPRHLAAVIAFESRFNPSAVNPYSGATGLIQFMPRTAVNLGTTTAALGRMSALEQLPYVERYFRDQGGTFENLQQVAMAVFYPVYRNKPPNTPFPADVQRANPGIKTPTDYLQRVLRAAQGVQPPPEPEAPPEIEVVQAERAPSPLPLPPSLVPAPLRAMQQSALELGQSVGQRISRTLF